MKTWRVRNDGEAAWPTGTVLGSAGGDVMSDVDLKVPVSLASAGEEIDISMFLTAPNNTGRHVAYFRLQSKDGTNFGQRLWADIRVDKETKVDLPVAVIAEPEWHIVGSSLLTTSAEAFEDEDEIEDEQRGMIDHDGNGAIDESNLPSELQSLSSSAELIESLSISQLSTSTSSLSAAEAASNLWARVWASELEVLAQMGFTDAKGLVPLLQEHLGVPAPQGQLPNADGMEQIIIRLLSLSHHTNR